MNLLNRGYSSLSSFSRTAEPLVLIGNDAATVAASVDPNDMVAFDDNDATAQ